MKQLFPLLLCCLVLLGCQSNPAQPVTPPEPTQAADFPAPEYVPGHPLAQSAPEALSVYPLEWNVQAMVPLGEKLLLLSGEDTTELILMDRESLTVLADYCLPFFLPEEGLHLDSGTLSCFDSTRQETLVLSTRLTEISRIAAPEGLAGTPIYSGEDNTLYYCTKDAIRAWNLDSGIRRCVREQDYSGQVLVEVHPGGILQCQIQDDGKTRTQFLSAQTGALLQESAADVRLTVTGGNYFASVPEGSVRLSLFGQAGSAPHQLTPRDISADCFFLPGENRAISVTKDLTLDCYDLETGHRTNTLKLIGQYQVLSVVSQGETELWLLLRDIAGDEVLCLWDLSAGETRVESTQVYIGPRYTRETPDTAGLARCQRLARQIGERRGIGILIGEDPLSVMPWDYRFETEYLVPVLEQELTELDKWLSDFPAEVFTGIREHFPSLSFCLVREIQGSPASGSVAKANGVQFFQGEDAYIALALGQYAQRALYHEMYHVMQTRLLTDSAAFDRWDALNPANFAYDYDYAANAARQADQYLQPETRSFIDRYSMSFPKEDRARILECAMAEGNEELFQSPVMQEKLACVCRAIREAYGLKGESYRWEQYLK